MSSASTTERFIAFTFAAADMVVETDVAGTITYAAGAFQSKFGCAPEALLGRPLHHMIVPSDRDVLAEAFTVLTNTGRLLPMSVRLSNAKASLAVLSGMALVAKEQDRRLCMTFGRPPRAPALSSPRADAAFSKTVEARLKLDAPNHLTLLEVPGESWQISASGEALDEVLGIASPGAIAHEISPGRFGVLGAPGAAVDVLTVMRMLEESLHAQGVDVSVKAQNIALSAEGLNPSQVARVLRHALSVFAREGAKGLGSAGLGNGLAEYIRGSAARTELLRTAIRHRRFGMVYQPIVRLQDRVTHHHEALIRPLPIADCPFASPQEFVLMVEALGLTGELDLAVTAMVAEAATSMSSSVAFNISNQSLQDAAFRPRLIKLLTDSGACAAGLLMVEMTETGELENLEEVNHMIQALRTLNVRFCLDDFGAGSTDIRLLKSLTADIIKLDGSYVAGITTDGRERAFVAGMVELARAAGVDVVAERVEIEGEAQALQNMGVHYGQGWLFGRPGALPPGQFKKIFRNRRFSDVPGRADPRGA